MEKKNHTEVGIKEIECKFLGWIYWHGYVLDEGTAYQGRSPRISQMTSRLLRHTVVAMRAHNVLCNSYNSITVEMNRCSFRRVRLALLYIVTRSKIV
jgi:hypothetical protein